MEFRIKEVAFFETSNYSNSHFQTNKQKQKTKKNFQQTSLDRSLFFVSTQMYFLQCYNHKKIRIFTKPS